MAAPTKAGAPTRGHRKRQKTRAQLIEAGIRVLAVKGEALTVSDVVAEADVSNGTFYNYFADRDALVQVLAEELLLSLAATAAAEPNSDPALRFAIATGRVLQRAVEDPTWGRLVLRLVDHTTVHDSVVGYLRADLEAGFASGRFDTRADDATLDQVTGLVAMTIRRIVAGGADAETPARAVTRGLRALGVPEDEASELAQRALG